MAVPVDIIVVDQSTVPVPLEDVLVNVYDASTLAYITGAVTDSDGEVALLLDGLASPGKQYEVRFFKTGVLFETPKIISVIEPLGVGQTNIFDHSGADSTILPLSTSTSLCRLSGFLKGLDNRPYVGALVRFLLKIESLTQVPRVFNLDNLIIDEHLEVTTDINGYISVDLIRNAEYYVTFSGNTDEIWPIIIPNTFAARFADVLHPYPLSLSWDTAVAPGNAVTLAVGEVLEVPYSVLFSDTVERTEGLSTYINFILSDETVVSMDTSDSSGLIVLTGQVAGTAQVSIETIPLVPPVRLPQYEVTATPLQITVT